MPSPKSPVILASHDQPARAPLASWYAQGPSDGFGDRLLMFDNAKTGPLELLRIRPDFAAVPGFEAALRTRFDRLASFSNRGFAQARVVKHLDQGEGLTVVSNHVAGTRLSDLFLATRPHPGMHPASVRAVFGDLVSSIAELHRQGRDIAHGALAPERTVLTSDRHLIVTDYVFGEALQRVNLSMERLWGEFGVVISDEHHALDQRCDVVQLGLLMLSLVLGRHISPGEYPGQLQQLLQDFTIASDQRARDVTPTLRTWLEQALDPAGFKNAIEAERAMAHPQALPRSSAAANAVSQPTVQTTGNCADDRVATSSAPQLSEPARDIAPVEAMSATDPIVVDPEGELEPRLARELSLLRESILDVDVVYSRGSETPDTSRGAANPVGEDFRELARGLSVPRTPADHPESSTFRESHFEARAAREADGSRPPSAHTSSFQAGDSAARWGNAADASRELFGLRAASAVDPSDWTATDERPFWVQRAAQRSASMFRWVALALGILVVAQGAIIFRLAAGSGESKPPRLTTPMAGLRETAESSSPANSNAASTGSEGLEPADTTPGSARMPAGADQNPPTVATTSSAAVARSQYPIKGNRMRTGSLRALSSIPLQVLAGDLVIGSTTGGPISLAPGTYDLTLVNDALNFRTQQTVRVAADRTVSISVAPPPGAISVTASPWAQVWIDGKQIGVTPIANISVPIGEHDLVFRHPQFGERRQKVLVQTGTMARASVTFTP